MAKMYYNLEEAMAKLHCTEDELRGMVRDDKLREFRDAGKLNYKVEEVDRLAAEQAGGNVLGHDSGGLSVDDLAEIALAPLEPDPGISKLSGSGSGAALTGTGSGAALSGTGSGTALGGTGSGSRVGLSGTGSGTVALGGTGTPAAKTGSGMAIDLTGSGTNLSGMSGSTQIRLEDTGSGTRATPPLKLDDSKAGSSASGDALRLDEVDKDVVQGMKKDDTVITNIGISVFDDDDIEIAADPMAKTMMTGGEEHLGLDGSGGGSGLLDLTRESDDTSLGAELLEGIDMGDTAETVAQTAAEPTAHAGGAGAESTTMPEAALGEPVVPMVPVQMGIVPVEPLAPVFTGLLAAATLVMALAGAAGVAMSHDVWPFYLQKLYEYFWIFLGGTLVLGAVSAGAGWLVARQSAAGPRPPKPPKEKKDKKAKGKKGEVGAVAAKA